MSGMVVNLAWNRGLAVRLRLETGARGHGGEHVETRGRVETEIIAGTSG